MAHLNECPPQPEIRIGGAPKGGSITVTASVRRVECDALNEALESGTGYASWLRGDGGVYQIEVYRDDDTV